LNSLFLPWHPHTFTGSKHDAKTDAGGLILFSPEPSGFSTSKGLKSPASPVSALNRPMRRMAHFHAAFYRKTPISKMKKKKSGARSVEHDAGEGRIAFHGGQAALASGLLSR
jgi:hypothetical protein